MEKSFRGKGVFYVVTFMVRLPLLFCGAPYHRAPFDFTIYPDVQYGVCLIDV
jgi:hypothetical protein